MKNQSLKLQDIVTTAGTQIRAKIDAEAVSDYADAMTDGVKFPPVVVFHDGSEYILADGFHRVMAASRNGFKDILAEIHKGTKADALKYALGANAAHGIKRTNADKRRSVELALAEWPKLSDRQIAEICAVSNNFVSEQRKSQLSSDDSSEPQTRIGRDGKERKMPERKPAPIVDVEPSLTPAKAREIVAEAEAKEREPKHRLTEFEEALAHDLEMTVADLAEILREINTGDADPEAIGEAKANLALLSKKLGQYERSIRVEVA